MNNYRFFTLIIFLTGVIVSTVGAMTQEITVVRSVICQEVVDRTPVGSGGVIPAGSAQMFCFTQINGARGETEITHNWYYKGDLKASVVLPVRSSKWRTWSSKSLQPEWTGEWMVEILSQDGTPLENIIFFVQ
jgi:hypothetical protein